jgi:hypothetical protein
MLGAQALRTKQKVERKEKEKRHKERVRNAEMQRERMQKAASEDSAANSLLDGPQQSVVVSRQRLSVSVHQHHRVSSPMDEGSRRTPSPTPVSAPALPMRSPSTDFSADHRMDHRLPSQNGNPSAGGRLMKFLGFSSNATQLTDQQKKEAKRRMSTF